VLRRRGQPAVRPRCGCLVNGDRRRRSRRACGAPASPACRRSNPRPRDNFRNCCRGAPDRRNDGVDDAPFLNQGRMKPRKPRLTAAGQSNAATKSAAAYWHWAPRSRVPGRGMSKGEGRSHLRGATCSRPAHHIGYMGKQCLTAWRYKRRLQNYVPEFVHTRVARNGTLLRSACAIVRRLCNAHLPTVQDMQKSAGVARPQDSTRG